MPKRPRQHTLEEESKLRFRQLLPPTWVYRDSLPDYGIDGQVEVFDEKGSSTGLVFLCQLKATDNKGVEKALKISLKKEVFDYYRSLPLPVMVVSYHSPSKQMFWRWIAEFDSYYSRGKKSLLFDIPCENIWNDRTSQIVVKDLSLLRSLRSGNFVFPITFYFEVCDEDYSQIPWMLIQDSLEKILRPYPHIVKISTKIPREKDFKLSLTKNAIVVSFTKFIFGTFHLPSSYYVEKDTMLIARDIVIDLAIFLGSNGCRHEACELIADHFTNSSWAYSMEYAIMIAGLFFRSGKVAEAIKIAENLLKLPGRELEALHFTLGALAYTERLSKSELVNYENVLKSFLKSAKKKKDKAFLASAHYNLGAFYRSQGQAFHAKALQHYKLAARYDPSYKEREYFWSEVPPIFWTGS